jgi:Leucine-rich repeat (LRR) protein
MKKFLNIALPILLICSLVVVLLNKFAPDYLQWTPKTSNTEDLTVISENFNPTLHHLDFRGKFRDAAIPNICDTVGESNLRFDIWSLDMADNDLTDIPDLDCLTNLKELNLSYNQLSDFPEFELSNSLEILNLSNNRLSNIDNLSKYLKVGEVQLSYNQFKTIDANLLPPNIIDLSLQHNAILSLKGFASLK